MEDERIFHPSSDFPLLLSSTLSHPVQLFCSIFIVGAMAAEWFVGPIMKKLINTCYEYLEDQFRWQTGMKEELERLRENHPKIQAVVFAASQEQIKDQNPALNEWLWQLRDAIDEADDVLDDFEYMKHEKQLTKTKKQTKVRSTMSSFKKIGKRALKIDPNLKRLEEVVQKLDKVSAEVGTFLHLLESTKQEQHLDLYKSRETGSLPKNDLIGRGKDKEFVMQWLKKPSDVHQTHISGTTTLYNNISLLSIVGHGGMGKTTLLQHVYEDEMMKEFDLKMWVCVSNNFDVKRVIADMLESLIKKKPDLESLDALQGSLKSVVSSKKFFLVLDDIWEEEEELDRNKWENVLAPLAYGGLGSKILVTTRMDSIALTISKVIKKKKKILRLEDLKEDECLQLLNTHAFADVEKPDDHKKLRSIARMIAKKLSGSPLAAKVIGGVLNSSLDERHWIKVINSDFGSGEMGQSNIFSIMRLSYIFLPKPLQNCFSFCSIFPQDHIFDKDDLIRMWIAVGFIQSPSNSGENMEDIGERYFDLLVKKSFFDKCQVNYKQCYKMHDLLHELAQSVSAHECFRVEGDKKLLLRIPKTIRHLSIKTSNLEMLKMMAEFKNLRSLHLTYVSDDQDFVDVLIKILKASRSIRLLYICAPSLKSMPEAIGYLIHLRYLRFEYTNITMLPRSLSNLYHLQFMIYNYPVKHFPNNFLPRDINNLSNLRYMKDFRNECFRMPEIGKLNSLQELNWFYVKNEAGYRIGELKHMNDLQKLGIKFLENVNDAEEARNTKLCDKRNLMNLSLEWSGIEARNHINIDEKVLDNLQPHNNLKELMINRYMGAKSPIWMNNVTLISNLEKIYMNECLEWQILPPFGHLPFLKYLHLYNMPKVKQLESKFHGNNNDCVFPSLEVLHIIRFEALEDWFNAAAATVVACLFPCLTELHLDDCPNFKGLSSLPPKLKKLVIWNIGWKYIALPNEIASLTIGCCPNLISLRGHQEVDSIKNCHLILTDLFIHDPSVLLMEPLRSITSIQNLRIEENDELVSFTNEADQWFLQLSSSLRNLQFFLLKSLQTLPSSLESLSSLEILHVENVPQLQLLPNIPTCLKELHLSKLESLECLPQLPPSLCKLSLSNLNNLDCLPSYFSSLSSLHILIIDKVPQLRELPDLPTSLQQLSITNCHPELMGRYKMFTGSDWHKIAHIDFVNIYTEQGKLLK